MSLLRTIAAGIRALVRRQRDVRDLRDLRDELEHYLSADIDERVRAGVPRDQAQRDARRALGGVDRTVEDVRGAGWEASIESVWRDLTYAWRSLRRQKVMAAAITLTLAIAIGATTAMLSIVDGVLLRDLPFANGGRLVAAVNRGVRPYDAISPPDYADWQAQIGAFDGLTTYMTTWANLTEGVSPVRLSVSDVTHDWFSVLGVHMALGRGFTAGEEGLGAPKVVVLSYGLWRRQFEADPAIVGRTVHLDGSPYAVVGVAARSMTFPEHTDLWRPIALTAQTMANRGSRVFWGPIGRLKPGATFARAEREVRVVAERLHAQFPRDETGLDYDIVPFRDHLVGGARTALVVLLGAVSCLLLLACVSIATLLLARATSRHTEIGLRLALGAGPRRIIRQLLVESVLLAIVGGTLGVVVALFAVRLVVAHGSGTIPLLGNVSVDVRVLTVTGIVILGAGILFGLAPALEAARTDVAASLTAGARGSSSHAGAARGRSALVSGELALAVPLLVAAILLGKSFVRLLAVDPGFRSAQVIRFDLTLPACGTGWAPDSTCAGVQGAHYTSPVARRNFIDQLLARLRALPGTRAVGAAFGVPFSEWARNQTAVNIDGRPPAPAGRPNVAESKYATAGYFAALGIPVVRGRAFSDADRATGPPIAIVSEGFVRAYLPGEDPIGKRVVGVGEIVGVVGDTKTQGLSTVPEPAIYQSLEQVPIPYITVVMRTSAAPNVAMPRIRSQVAAIDPALPVSHLMTMDDAVRASAGAPRLDAWVVAGFAALALLLAILGVYGVIAFGVRERHRELGIRLALGARGSDIVRLVLARGLRVALVGLAAGCVLAVAAGEALRGLLFGVQALDAGTYVFVCALLLTMAVLASWIPARRAARVDAAVSLRSE